MRFSLRVLFGFFEGSSVSPAETLSFVFKPPVGPSAARSASALTLLKNLKNPHRDSGASLCVSKGMMMMGEVVAAGRRHRLQLMVRQRMPEVAP